MEHFAEFLHTACVVNQNSLSTQSNSKSISEENAENSSNDSEAMNTESAKDCSIMRPEYFYILVYFL